MLSTIALVVAGLATGHKIGLTAVAAAFILFALVSSFVVPRRSPNFPGRGMAVYVTVCVLFFVAMIASVLLLGKEREAGNEPVAQTETQSSSLPGQTTSTKTATTGTSTAAASSGDAVAGKAVFESAGCSSCHTLKAAGATGTVGPNLDTLKPPEEKVRTQVTNGGAIMPPFKGKLSAKQIDDVATFVFTSTHS